MNRRNFLAGALATLACPAIAQGRWPNGELMPNGTFAWTVGGGDPYRGSLRQALALAGITERRVQQLIASAVQAAPNGNAARFQIYDGQQMGVMISGSGGGWAARHAVAYPSRWPPGRTRWAKLWYIRDEVTGVQYRVVYPLVCGNWSFDYYGAAEQCPCRPNVDAC